MEGGLFFRPLYSILNGIEALREITTAIINIGIFLSWMSNSPFVHRESAPEHSQPKFAFRRANNLHPHQMGIMGSAATNEMGLRCPLIDS
jgi:hypothetical protein